MLQVETFSIVLLVSIVIPFLFFIGPSGYIEEC